MASSTERFVALDAPSSLGKDARLIGLVGLAHLTSHFSQLLLPPLFPWLKDAFNASYTELGFLMTIFFVASCITQTLSGFWVDKYGPRPILYLGLSLLGLAAFGFASSTQYWMMGGFSALAGIGNGVFHPVDYTLLNRKISPARLGHAYSTHGITGSLGWALAPVMMVPLAIAFSWRVAFMGAGALAFSVLALHIFNRAELSTELAPSIKNSPAKATLPEGGFNFLKLPAVWMCFTFFLLYAVVISVIQAFAPEAARQLYGVPLAMAAGCLSIYMVGSASGMVLGGFLVANPSQCERIVALAFAIATAFSLALGFASLVAAWVPILFGVMGFASGLAGPARGLLIKRSTPENSTGRVYGVVYSGLDIGQALAPLGFGYLMDQQKFSSIFLGLAFVQGLMIFSALSLGRVRRSVL